LSATWRVQALIAAVWSFMSQEKTILITNDDGIRSLGLLAAANALSDLGRLIIVAPSVQKSGVGRSLSLFEPIRVSSAKVEGYEAYAVAGTPTDAVLIAEYAILKRKPDLLVAGINVGENLSTESVMTSGTLGAALTGASQDIPAIAISLQAHRAHVFEARSEVDFGLAADAGRTLAAHTLARGLPAKVDVLNVNVPMGVAVTRYKTTRLQRNVFDIRIIERLDPRGNAYFWIGSDFKNSQQPDTDVYALNNGFVSVTPLTLDNTAATDERSLQEWLKAVDDEPR
jgi:5'-nucleotidase